MTLTKQDLVTFAIGLGAAVLLQIGVALAQLDASHMQDWGAWGSGFGVGILSAAGRYLVTELTERGLGPKLR